MRVVRALLPVLPLAAALACGANAETGGPLGDPSTGDEDAAATPASDAAAQSSEPAADAGTPPPSRPDASADAAVACLAAVASPGSGHHNAGTDCGSCHDSFSASLRWTVAGTLYTATRNGSAVSGATIKITDATNEVVKLATMNNGNFYTTTAVKFPLHVRASKCPSDQTMLAGASQGSCNTSGCHSSGMRIHLP